MEIVAVSRSIRIAPRKVRLVADSIRKLSVDEALANLSLIEKRGAAFLSQTLKSAIANAAHNAKKNKNDLVIKSIDVFDGPSLKRAHASTMGRSHPYKKRASHIKVVLEAKESV